MATLDSDAYVRAQNGVVRLAVRDLRAYWSTLDHSDPLAVRVALETFWPVLLARYGEVTATLAVDRFEDLTGLPGVMVRAVDAERANVRLRWAMGAAFAGDPARSLALLEGLTDELSKQPGRSSFFRSARERKVRVARVPVGKTCAFCLMAASRGFVYASQETAGMVNRWHGDCDCRWAVEGEDVPGYDPDDLYETYLLARDKADSGKTAKILSALREIEGTN